jgi:AcrR family transcriptional regulator
MATVRRTQRERREETRTRLLRATIEALVELGYAGTTTSEVQARAGVSRGAVLHHFPAKAELLTAAVGRIADAHIERLKERQTGLPRGADRPRAAVYALREAFSGPYFLAGSELWMAARTDPGLRTVLVEHERRVGHALHEVCGKLFGAELAGRPGFRPAVELTLMVLRGLALTDVLRDDERLNTALLDIWAGLLPAAANHG